MIYLPLLWKLQPVSQQLDLQNHSHVHTTSNKENQQPILTCLVYYSLTQLKSFPPVTYTSTSHRLLETL